MKKTLAFWSICGQANCWTQTLVRAERSSVTVESIKIIGINIDFTRDL